MCTLPTYNYTCMYIYFYTQMQIYTYLCMHTYTDNVYSLLQHGIQFSCRLNSPLYL